MLSLTTLKAAGLTIRMQCGASLLRAHSVLLGTCKGTIKIPMTVITSAQKRQDKSRNLKFSIIINSIVRQ